MRISTVLGPALALPLALTVGCGSGGKYAPVSGRVTLNGQPLANATVSFQPIAEGGEVNAPAPGSTGQTNANGEFTLMSAGGRPGAWVGKHVVRITAVTEQAGTGDERPPRGGWPKVDKIPARYNSDSKEEFTVPVGGTDKADFVLTTP
jgi:hypothetical protein